MSRIDITSPAGGSATIPDGMLQTANPLDATLQVVTDNVGNSSTVSLSTTETQINSVLRIRTNSSELLDIENTSGNRFNINRDVQKINLDFSSNPTGSTSIVGGIRTFVDGTNLSDVITFIENGTIGINNTNPDASAQVDIASTTKGFLFPRMTDTQRAAIASPAEGLIVFNTTNKGVAYRDGTNWGYLSGAPQTVAGSGGTVNISFASGNIVNLTLTASTTLTLSGHVVGTYIIKVIQGGSGSYTLTYPASVKWSGGTAPTLTTAVGKIDIITLFHDGTDFFGTYSLNY
jgi:hypothetical protein